MKTMIIKAPKVKKFDLTYAKPQEKNRVISAIESLKQDQGWQLMVQVHEQEVAKIEKSIITGFDADGKQLSTNEIDLLRIKRAYLVEMIEMPDKLLAQVSREETPVYDADPYDKGGQDRRRG